MLSYAGFDVHEGVNFGIDVAIALAICFGILGLFILTVHLIHVHFVVHSNR